MSDRYYNMMYVAIAASVLFISIGIIIGYTIHKQEAQAVLCPVNNITELAEQVKENIWNYKYDEARQNAQDLINLVDKLEEDKIAEDAMNNPMYN